MKIIFMEIVFNNKEKNKINQISIPKKLEYWEKPHLLKVLEKCREPGQSLIEKLDYYLLPGSLIRRETRYQFFRNDLECAFPNEFEITKKEKLKMKRKMQKVYGIENIRNAAYIIGTIVSFLNL